MTSSKKLNKALPEVLKLLVGLFDFMVLLIA